MKISKLFLMLGVLIAANLLVACNNDKSYAELLQDERYACNAFLSNFQIKAVPADSVFEVGPQAPYYKLDQDGNVYMQVLNTGDLTKKAKVSQEIYFRFTRYNLKIWYQQDKAWIGAGNADDMSQPATYFKFQDFSLPVLEQWGYGIQMPLNYLGTNCEVNLVIKARYGWKDEESNGVPFMYHVRYFPSKI